jgi:hypothetical protein
MADRSEGSVRQLSFRLQVMQKVDRSHATKKKKKKKTTTTTTTTHQLQKM